MEVNPYEKFWIALSVTAILVMLVAVGLAGFGLGIQLPGEAGALDPAKLSQEPPFNQPGVYETAPGKFQVVMLAQIWAFIPAEIKIPQGAEVTFKITSRDITHGILLEDSNLNIMILPGQVAEFSHTFTKSGEFRFVCHEYCGVGHQAMAGKIIVEPK